MLDDAAEFLIRSRQEPGHIFECHQRNIECVAEADEARTFDRTCDIQTARQVGRLICHDPNGTPIQTRESDDQVFCVVFLNLEKIILIDHRVDNVLHVVWYVRLGRHHCVQRFFNAIPGIVCRSMRRVLQVVRGNERKQLA